MARLPSESAAQAPKSRRALRWSLLALLLLTIALILAVILSPGGPGTAGPGAPTASSTDETSAPASDTQTDDPSGTPTDDPSDTPTDGSSDSPTDSGSPAPPSAPPVTSAPSPAAPGELDEDSATQVLSTAIETPLTSAETEDALAEVLTDIAVEGYAAELEAQWLELTSQGWSTTGTARIDSLEITALDSASPPATAEVAACLDSSEVLTLDAEGAPIGDPAAASPRALHLFTMVQGEDGIWRISSHSFPNDPSC